METTLRHDTKGRILKGGQAQDLLGVDQPQEVPTTKNAPTSNTDEGAPSHEFNNNPLKPAHQRFVFTDPVAFR